MRALTTAFVLFAILSSERAAAQGAEKAQMAHVMWSAFTCAIYAEISDQKEEQKRLKEVGIRAGRKFLAALLDKEIGESEYSKHVPVVVTLLLGGPSVDFMLGRIFENATKKAWDKSMEKVGTYDDLGKTIQKAKARNLFHASNCAIIVMQ